MAARGRDERRDDRDEVVVHVAGVAEGVCGGGHDGCHELVGLREGGFLDVQAVLGDVGEGFVVEDDDAVGVLREAAHAEEGVVWVDDHPAAATVFGEDGVGLDEAFGVAVGEFFEEERAEAGTGTPGDGV